MIGPTSNVAALSFTRELNGAGSTEQSGITRMPSMGPTPGEAVGTDFETTLAGITSDMIGDLRGAEKMSLAGIAGKAETREVVDAVMTAEQTLRTAIAIRDKIVSAYLEISRMQI